MTDVTLTDDEAAAVDFAMSEHMRGHANSNNVNGMTCDIDCRTRALGKALSPVLAARLAQVTADRNHWHRELERCATTYGALIEAVRSVVARIEDGCDHEPRVGGWCLACESIRADLAAVLPPTGEPT